MQRKSIHVILRRRCDGGESPNAYIPYITTEIRAHFPPHVTRDQIRDVLAGAMRDAEHELEDIVLDGDGTSTEIIRKWQSGEISHEDEDDDDPKYVIWSNEHRKWWSPASLGYTTLLEEAGRYSYADAKEIVSQATVGGQLVVNRDGTPTFNEHMLLAPEYNH